MLTKRTMLLASAATVLLTGSTWAGSSKTEAPATYRLDSAALFLEGCFDLCACPIHIGADLAGTFRLEPTRLTGTLDTYAVTDVQWTVFDGEVTITGAGVYTRFSEVVVQQRLELDLVVGDADVQHFDSGLVAAASPFPLIDVTICVNQMLCFDTVITVVAGPLSADVNQDGVIDFADLLLVLSSWGPCADVACPADVTGDGLVDFSDLLLVVTDWS